MNGSLAFPRASSLRIRGALACLCLVWACLLCPAAACAQPAPSQPPDPAAIRDNLNRILSAPEFAPAGKAENPLDRAMQWAGDQLKKLWQAVRRLFTLPVSLAGGSAGLQWAFILLFTLAFARFLARLLAQYRKTGSRKPGRQADIATALEMPDAAAQEPEAWLTQAQHYAAQGDHRSAFRAVFLAILGTLDRAGAIRYERSRTNGDYLRSLRRQKRGDLHDLLLPLSREFDRRWYGGQETTEADYRRSLSALETLRERLASRRLPETAVGEGAASR